MARYERGGEFWDFARDGTKITITTGEIGTPGTTVVEELASGKLAETRERVLLNKQGRDGWKLAKAAPPEAAPPSLPPPPVVHDARDPALERAILEDPENDSLYEVYGDWLQQQGDPRGKLIALEVATRDKPFGDRNHAARDNCIKVRAGYFFGTSATGRACHGSLLQGADLSMFLRLGFVSSLQVMTGRFHGLVDVLREPALRFSTRVRLDARTPEEADEDFDGAAALASAIRALATHAPSTLRHLEIGGDTSLDDLDALKPRLPELRSFTIASPADRELAVRPPCLRALINSKWPRLEHLRLELLGDTCSITDLSPLFATPMPKVVGVHVRTTFDDDILSALATSPLAAQLEGLTFEAPGGEFRVDRPADAFAEELLRHRARFPRLRELGLPHQRFSAEALASLAAFGTVHDANGEARYEDGGE